MVRWFVAQGLNCTKARSGCPVPGLHALIMVLYAELELEWCRLSLYPLCFSFSYKYGLCKMSLRRVANAKNRCTSTSLFVVKEHEDGPLQCPFPMS